MERYAEIYGKEIQRILTAKMSEEQRAYEMKIALQSLFSSYCALEDALHAALDRVQTLEMDALESTEVDLN